MLLDDETQAIVHEITRQKLFDKLHIRLDFFDASINRIAAWVIGTCNAKKALLRAQHRTEQTSAGVNVQLDPADSLVLLQVDDKGLSYKIHWGLSYGGLPTSKLAAHFQSHSVRKQVSNGADRVIMHCYATNFMVLSYVVNLDSARFTRLLWEGSTVPSVWWCFRMASARRWMRRLD